jgi:acyl-coenzyme A thioesterase PaaI-like protein
MPNVDFDAIAKGMSIAVPFAGYLGLDITEVGPGEATVVLPRKAELNNHVGSQHAGALFTDVTPLARSAEIDYLKIAHGAITAKGTLGMDAAKALAILDEEGKVEFPCEVELTDKDGELVATATVHWHVRLKG